MVDPCIATDRPVGDLKLIFEAGPTVTVIEVSKEPPPEEVSLRFIVLVPPWMPMVAMVITQFPEPPSAKDESQVVVEPVLKAQVIVLLPSDACSLRFIERELPAPIVMFGSVNVIVLLCC